MRGDTPIDGTEDILDSRDVLDRIEYLGYELEMDRLAGDDNEEGYPLSDDPDERDMLRDEYRAELTELERLDDERPADDWTYGATLIADSYFKEYAQQFADDIGAIDREAHWPLGCIDWDQAARELQMDYTSCELFGTTYWTR